MVDVTQHITERIRIWLQTVHEILEIHTQQYEIDVNSVTEGVPRCYVPVLNQNTLWISLIKTER